MDELVLSGKKYISSKRAAEITGYAKDYVGQLARSGKVDAKRVGRAWYVLEAGILEHHAQGEAESSQVVSRQSVVQKPVLSPSFYSVYSFPRTWNQIQYLDDDADLFPAIPEKAQNEPQIVSSSANIKILRPQLHNELPQPQSKAVKSVRNSNTSKAIVFDIPKPTSSVLQKAPVRSMEEKPSFDLVPLAALGVSALAVVIIASGANLPSISFTGAGQYTATPLQGLYDAWGAFIDGPFVQDGIRAVTEFFELLFNSFWSFFETGLAFLKDLF